MVLSVCVGLHIGAWLNYQTGTLTQTNLSQPYTIMWPSLLMCGRTILRTIIGFTFVLSIKTFGKQLSYIVLCTILGEKVEDIKKAENTLHNKHKTFVELGSKYFTCAAIGFCTLYVLPPLFRFINIERPTFYTEI